MKSPVTIKEKRGFSQFDVLIHYKILAAKTYRGILRQDTCIKRHLKSVKYFKRTVRPIRAESMYRKKRHKVIHSSRIEAFRQPISNLR